MGLLMYYPSEVSNVFNVTQDLSVFTPCFNVGALLCTLTNRAKTVILATTFIGLGGVVVLTNSLTVLHNPSLPCLPSLIHHP